jgi:acetoin utilization protein AcuC
VLPPDPRRAPLLVGSEIYRRSTYGPKHPLAIPRVSTALDLIRALGWLDPERYIDSPRATPEALARFHHPDYIAALQRAEAAQRADPADRERFGIGAHGNPVFREVFSRPATGAGGTALAARLTLAGGAVHVPGGGTHHGQPARASGFCYLNDAVLGLCAWLDGGLDNLLYVDVDAHHGDGVQDAFRDDPRVFTLSVHEKGRWPHTGGAEDRAGGHARNLPVPPGFNDSEMLWLLHQAVLPIVRHLRPQAIMLQCGADALEEDPLSRLSLSNNAHWGVVRALMGAAPRFVVLGGGGYNPWSVGRCWAGVWGTLNGHAIPERLPPAAEAVLRGLSWERSAGRSPPEHWFTTLRDQPRPGVVRAEVQRLAAGAVRDLPAPLGVTPSRGGPAPPARTLPAPPAAGCAPPAG